MIPRGLVGPSRRAPSPSEAQPSVRKGGLEPIFKVKVGEHLACVAVAPDRLSLAAATGTGAVVFIDAADGATRARFEGAGAEEAPNALAFGSDSRWVVAAYDDGYARVAAADSGTLLVEHAVAEAPTEGKRARRCAADHVVTLASAFASSSRLAFVAAAGRLVHAVAVPGGALEHALVAEKPVRGLCVPPPGGAQAWAYAASHQGGVLLVSRRGEVVRRLSSDEPLRAVAAFGRWLAAAAFDGSVELWDVAASSGKAAGPGGSDHLLRTSCGSDGEALAWAADGSGLAVSGKRAAIYDFTGLNPAHPYRRGDGAPGAPDPVPIVCMDDGHHERVAWAPHARGRGAATTLATLGRDGALRLWQPRGRPLRKGGNGNPAQPERMKPQFYTFVKLDAAHPTGAAVRARGLDWLSETAVVAGFANGDVVAWRLPPYDPDQ